MAVQLDESVEALSDEFKGGAYDEITESWDCMRCIDLRRSQLVYVVDTYRSSSQSIQCWMQPCLAAAGRTAN